MSSTRSSRRSDRTKKNKKNLVLVLLSLVVFWVGYYVLEVISRGFDLYLGNTFYVILGCSLMAIPGVFIIYIIKETYFIKKKKRVKQVFLKDDSKENKSE
jgi:glucose uptake protein GlcU